MNQWGLNPKASKKGHPEQELRGPAFPEALPTLYSPELGDTFQNPKLLFDNIVLYLVHAVGVGMGAHPGHGKVLSEPGPSLVQPFVNTSHEPHSTHPTHYLYIPGPLTLGKNGPISSRPQFLY